MSTGIITIAAATVTLSDNSTLQIGPGSLSVTYTAAVSGGIALPPGYSASGLIWNEPFTSLDSTKWNPWFGDATGTWDQPGLASNESALGPTNNAEYTNPSQLAFGSNGLTITAQRHSKAGYTWLSGAMNTGGKWSTPANTPSLVRIVAKCPDMSTGAWPAWWRVIPNAGGANNHEFDDFEGGFLNPPLAINHVGHTTLEPNNPQIYWDAGVDLSAGFNTFDTEYVPGVSFTSWFNGVQVASVTANVPNVQYELLIDLSMANGNTSSWHSVTGGSTPSPLTLQVKQLQVYTR